MGIVLHGCSRIQRYAAQRSTRGVHCGGHLIVAFRKASENLEKYKIFILNSLMKANLGGSLCGVPKNDFLGLSGVFGAENFLCGNLGLVLSPPALAVPSPFNCKLCRC